MTDVSSIVSVLQRQNVLLAAVLENLTPTANAITTAGGTISGGPLEITNTSTTAIATSAASLTVNLNGSPGITAEYINSSAIGVTGAPLVLADAIQGVAEQTSGSSANETSAVSGYILNNATGGLGVGGAIALGFTGISAVNGAQTWGVAGVLCDTVGFTGVTAGTARQLFGVESDLNVSSPSTRGSAYTAGGTALTPSAFLVGYSVGVLGGGAGAKWSIGFASTDGGANNAFYIGRANATGISPSQYMTFNWTDGSSVQHYLEMLANNNTLTLTSDIGSPIVAAGGLLVGPPIAAPATPAAGTFVLYVDTADDKLKVKGASGTVTILAVP